MPSIRMLVILDAEKGVGAASVECAKRAQRVPILVCEACPSCVHSSRPTDPKMWILVCTA